MNSYLRTALVICVAATLVVVGVIAYALIRGPSDEDVVGEGSLAAFSSYAQLRDFLEDSAGERYNDYPYEEFALSGDSTDSKASYSTTNIQVSGVDEQDIVKTDGEHVFVSTYNEVTIIKAYPPEEMEVMAVLTTADILGYVHSDEVGVYISGMFVSEDRLVVVSSVYEYYYWTYYWEDSYYSAEDFNRDRSVLSVFDIDDIQNPELIYSFGVSGFALTTRMIGDVVYLVAQSGVYWYDAEYTIPRVWMGSEATDFSPSDVYYDSGTKDSDAFVNLLSLDVETGLHDEISVVTGYASTIYMSVDSLYISFQKWSGGLLLLDGEAVAESESSTRTTIHKISVDGLSMTPLASGDVMGWLLNQFSMDEKDGILRVATTTSWVEPENCVYVLSSNMSVVGSLEGLAPTERIYAARFLGDTLYLVTFLQIDPLFVIDLSEPTSPAVLGELKIPGFSSYLHPIGDDLLLGIGRENDSVKISLFDISDPTKPVEKDTYLVGSNSYSEATYEHKAVLYHAERGMLVIPVTTYAFAEDRNVYDTIRGAWVFNVSASEGISLMGIVDHSVEDSYNYVVRSLYIGETLYSVSYEFVKANSLIDLSEEGALEY